MIDTLMALWNRGYAGRSTGIFFAFILICISISLLLAMTGVSWLFKLPHEGPPDNQRTFVNAASLTTTAPVTPAGSTATATGTTSRPCSLTPVISKTATRQVRTKNGSNFPRRSTETPGPGSVPGVTPTVKVTSTPRPRPTITQTATPGPTSTVTPPPTVTATTTITATATVSPTATPPPTVTATVTATATTTPSPTSTPLPTSTGITGEPPVATNTPVITSTPSPTSRVMRGDGKPAATVKTNVNRGHPHFPGSSGVGSRGKAESQHTDCLSASIAFMEANPAMFVLGQWLGQYLWLVSGGSCLCTLLFMSMPVMLRRKRRGE